MAYSPAMRALVLVALLSLTTLAEARPFRAMMTRTAETTSPLNFELGLRYQGFFAGRGSGSVGALPYHQLSPGLRIGLVEGLELNAYVEFLLLDVPSSPNFRAFLGDIPIGLQWTFVDTRMVAMGVWLRGTIPSGPSGFDIIPPALSDGTLDAEASFIAEVRFTRDLRLMANLGYLYHGVRDRGAAADFDVPDALRYDVALAYNLSDDLLLGVELNGRFYLDPVITPVWNDNANQLEVLPHLRLETIPNLVLEAAIGVALVPDLQEIYLVRGLLGFTYEFDLGGSDRRPSDEDRPRSRRRGRGR